MTILFKCTLDYKMVYKSFSTEKKTFRFDMFGLFAYAWASTGERRGGENTHPLKFENADVNLL